MKFIALVDALHVVHRLNFYVKDVGLLDSALARPASEMFGVEAYPAFELKAAALHQSLVTYHALLDGNKRLAWLLLNVFVELNGFELVIDISKLALDATGLRNKLLAYTISIPI